MSIFTVWCWFYFAIQITKVQTPHKLFSPVLLFIVFRDSFFLATRPFASAFSHLPADAYNYGNVKEGPKRTLERAQIKQNEKSTRKVNTRCSANENFYEYKRQHISINSRQYKRTNEIVVRAHWLFNRLLKTLTFLNFDCSVIKIWTIFYICWTK